MTKSPKAILNKITQLPGIGKIASDRFGFGDEEAAPKKKTTTQEVDKKPEEELKIEL